MSDPCPPGHRHVVAAQRSPFTRALDCAQREPLGAVVAVGGGERHDQRDEPARVGHGFEIDRALGEHSHLAGVCASFKPSAGQVAKKPALIWCGAGDRGERGRFGSDGVKALDVAPRGSEASVHNTHRLQMVTAAQFDLVEQPEHCRAAGGMWRHGVPGGNRGRKSSLPVGSDAGGLNEVINGLGTPEALLIRSKVHQDRHPRLVLRRLGESTAQKHRGGRRRAARGRRGGSVSQRPDGRGITARLDVEQLRGNALRLRAVLAQQRDRDRAGARLLTRRHLS